MAKRICNIEDCEATHQARGWCSRHYEAWRRHGDPLTPIHSYRRQGCLVLDCADRHDSHGYCRRHSRLWKAHGDPLKQINASPGHADHLDAHGYRHIHVDGRIVAEHRWVMEQQLDRPLLPHEHVHHRNGDRADNRPENLELWLTRQPKGQRVADLLMFVVEHYRPELEAMLEEA